MEPINFLMGSFFVVWYNVCIILKNKKMKPLYILIFLINATLLSCSSVKQNDLILQNNPPFKVVKATYKSWVGGQPGIKGYQFFIEISDSKVRLDSVYFRGFKAALEKDELAKKLQYNAVIRFPREKPDLILHENPKKEYGNQPPIIPQKIPFNLNQHEAVVSYIYKNKKWYYKVAPIHEIK